MRLYANMQKTDEACIDSVRQTQKGLGLDVLVLPDV